MSYARSPRLVVSTTIGTRPILALLFSTHWEGVACCDVLAGLWIAFRVTLSAHAAVHVQRRGIVIHARCGCVARSVASGFLCLLHGRHRHLHGRGLLVLLLSSSVHGRC